LRTRIKFCGITRAEDIQQAVALGVDAIGLILVPGSKRELKLEQAAALSRSVPPMVTLVCLVADAGEDLVRAILSRMRVDLLQFHGKETDQQCNIYGRPFVKAVAMGDDNVAVQLEAWPSAAGLVLDGHRSGELGGQGQRFDWSRQLHRGSQPIVLAGGLSEHNVAEAIAAMRPYAVDVSSGIESAPRIKDGQRMQAFISEVQRADKQYQ